MSSCARVLSGQVKAGSQRHFYMVRGATGRHTYYTHAIAPLHMRRTCPQVDRCSLITTVTAAAAAASASYVLHLQEPQVAVVTPDEAGRLQVVSSCQGCDYVSVTSCCLRRVSGRLCDKSFV
jgi:hypothetical protein